MQKKSSKAGFYQGWSTTDEQEIERRRYRGEKEPFTITPLEEKHFPFGAYRVESPTGSNYDVEIRTLNTLENSCGCPDYSVNGLGTCKHIEGVVYHLQQRYQKNWDQLSRQKPTWMEVILDVKGSQSIKLWNPIPLDSNCATSSTLPTLFSSDNILHTPDAKKIASLREALQKSPGSIQRKIRISKFVDNWVLQNERKNGKSLAKQQFLEKVKLGEESLNILKVPLYPYQEEGMLHLVFNERALLADEMGLGKTIQAIAACELLRRLKGIKKVLLIAPASLKTEWEEQILKFTDLPSLLIQGPRHARIEQY
jgi:hypothetical protein